MSDSDVLTVAAIQWQHRRLQTFDDFAKHVMTLLDRCRSADIVVFPELFTVSLVTISPVWERLDSSAIGRLTAYTDDYRHLFRGEAVSRKQAILAGSQLVGTASQNLNTAHLFLPDGSSVTHAKTHLFPLEFATGTAEGDELAVANLGAVTIGIAICYEAEIPEVSTILARQGAEVIVCPSYTVTPAGYWRVRHCAQARCVENQVYFVQCCTVGRIGGPILDGYGRSAVMSPCDVEFPADGLLVQAEPDVEDVIEAKLDLGALRANRQGGAAPTHRDRLRRSSLYRLHEDELLARSTQVTP